MPFISLPTEVLLHVGIYLENSDIDSMVRTCRHTYHVFNQDLWRRATKRHQDSCGEQFCDCYSPLPTRGCRLSLPVWRAITTGNVEALRKLLDIGRAKFQLSHLKAAISQYDSAEIVDLLVGFGTPSASPLKEKWARSAICLAFAHSRKADMLTAVLKHNPSLEDVSWAVVERGCTCVGFASCPFNRRHGPNSLRMGEYLLGKLMVPYGIRKFESMSFDQRGWEKLIHHLVQVACFRGRVSEVGRLLDLRPKNSPSHKLGHCDELFLAIQGGNEGMLRFLLDAGLDPNATFRYPKRSITPVFVALQFQRLAMAQLLLDRGALIDGLSDRNVRTDATPVFGAVASGSVAMVTFALSKGATIFPAEFALHQAISPLECARSYAGPEPSANRSVTMLEHLLTLGAPIDSQDKAGMTPLLLAVKENWADGVEFLLDNGVDVEGTSIPSSVKSTPLAVALDNCSAGALEVLLRYGANPHRSGGQNPLAMASSPETVDLLIRHGASFDIRYNYLEAPIGTGYAPLVSCLLEHGHPVVIARLSLSKQPLYQAVHRPSLILRSEVCKEWRSDIIGMVAKQVWRHVRGDGTTSKLAERTLLAAMEHAIFSHKVEAILKLLQGLPAAPELEFKVVYHALQQSCRHQRGDAAKVILGYINNRPENRRLECVNHPTVGNQTLLHQMARIADAELLKVLLEGGADSNMQMAGGNTALHLIASITRKRPVEHMRLCIKTLVDQGAALDVSTDTGRTPLHIAARRSQLSDIMLESLLRHGRDQVAAAINIQDFRGRTALHYVAERDTDMRARAILYRYGARHDIADRDGMTASMLPRLAARDLPCSSEDTDETDDSVGGSRFGILADLSEEEL